MVSVAFGGGIMLAAILGERKHRHGQDYARAAAGTQPNGQTSGASHKAIETIDTIKNAIIGVAATKVKDFVGDIIPGFQEELQSCEENRGANLS